MVRPRAARASGPPQVLLLAKELLDGFGSEGFDGDRHFDRADLPEHIPASSGGPRTESRTDDSGVLDGSPTTRTSIECL